MKNLPEALDILATKKYMFRAAIHDVGPASCRPYHSLNTLLNSRPWMTDEGRRAAFSKFVKEQKVWL